MDSSTDLICLSYCSTASFASAPRGFGVDPEVTRILVHSRRNNKRRNVGGGSNRRTPSTSDVSVSSCGFTSPMLADRPGADP